MKTVLLIEQDLGYAEVLTMLLQDEGFEVLHSTDAIEGVALFRERCPDLLITDIILANADGLEMLMKIKEEFPECRVIAISGGLEGDASWLLPLGSLLPNYHFLHKPFAFRSLRKLVNQALSAPVRKMSSRKTTVLVVDDDAAVRQVLARLLQSSGLEVVTAGGAEEALTTMQASHFDVIVADLIMPGVTGLELISRIRAIAPTIPVIAVTGELMRGVALLQDADQSGIMINATLVKPFTSKELVKAVQRCAAGLP